MGSKRNISIPAVPSGQPPATMRFLQAVRDTVLQLAQIPASNVSSASPSIPHQGGNTNPNVAPTPPFDLTCTQSGMTHTLRWSVAVGGENAFTEVWCSTKGNDISSATRVATLPAVVCEYTPVNILVDVDRYYWIRTGTVYHKHSGWIPDSGGLHVPAVTIVSLNDLLSRLAQDEAYKSAINVLATSLSVLPDKGDAIPVFSGMHLNSALMPVQTGVFDPDDTTTFTALDDGRKAVRLSGTWSKKPQILLTPRSIQTYDKTYPSLDQTLQLHAEVLAVGNGQYQFVPTATLHFSDNTEKAVSGSLFWLAAEA
ncbi:hypothetical protein [Halodesulfovibrio sp.]|jgi:hypothetical protein|uniref:hypothetical protein n=1 Tax=Halodesulfovibrio sp. TaxID=1912772 RepID=UPI0025FFB7E0|nr:hypothetical protein [Halodesulfovibrio sp.]MCT4627935.1 hypothetical protein [Halodesulfovibrio sp.]